MINKRVISWCFALFVWVLVGSVSEGLSAFASSMQVVQDARSRPAPKKAAPYTNIRWREGEERPDVWVNDAWYQLQAIDDLEASEMVAFAKNIYPSKWQKRIAEDLVELMVRMEKSPRAVADLTLVDLGSGDIVTLNNLPMTSANRQAIWQARNPGQQRFVRVSEVLTRGEALADLRRFREHLEKRFSYLEVEETEYEEALRKLEEKINAGISISDFRTSLQRVIGLFIDGHAGVGGGPQKDKYLPFLIDPGEEGFFAYLPERSELLNNEYPVIAKIDGHTIETWAALLSPYIANGSEQYVTREVLRRLRRLADARLLAGISQSNEVRVQLRNPDWGTDTTLVMKLSNDFPSYGAWPRSGSSILAGNIGYLRLKSMNDQAVAEVETWMPQFEDTKGLIIDVRSNTGGSRDALVTLFPYFMQSEETPYVVNAAKYRLNDWFDEDHLEARNMYRADATQWTAAERAAIADFSTSFTPEWQPPADKFSEWHYLVFSKSKDDPRYYYKQPVIVLMDDRCFSATDIFLSAFKGWRNVTLMGRPSGGGSARSIPFELDASGLRGRLGSMASFQRDGKLYDGNGILPDIEVWPEPKSALKGGVDNTLELAVQRLHSMSN